MICRRPKRLLDPDAFNLHPLFTRLGQQAVAQAALGGHNHILVVQPDHQSERPARRGDAVEHDLAVNPKAGRFRTPLDDIGVPCGYVSGYRRFVDGDGALSDGP